MNETASPPLGGVRRLAPIAAACVVGVALAGFLRGITEPPRVTRPPTPAESPASDVPAAVRYDELRDANLRANADRQSQLKSLRFEQPGLFDPVVRTEALKQEALAERAARRAFDGAPPTVPHPIEQTSAASCLACHGAGLRVSGRLAPKVSHPHYTSCTQCHVEGARSGLTEAAEPAENTFAGVSRSGPGARAWPGAPPTIPHTTWFREDCASCHGLVARSGLRTTHPWQASCTQCHAPSAALDQAPFPPEEPHP